MHEFGRTPVVPSRLHQIPLQWLQSMNCRHWIQACLQAFGEPSHGRDPEVTGEARTVEIRFDEQDAAVPAFRQGSGEIQSDRGFAVVRQGAGDDNRPEPDERAEFPQTHAEKAEAIGARTSGVRKQDDALGDRWVYRYDVNGIELRRRLKAN